MTVRWLCYLDNGTLKSAGCKSVDKVSVLKSRLKSLLGVAEDDDADLGAEAEGAARQSIQARAAAAKDPAAMVFIVRQTLDPDAKELGRSKETLQKVIHNLDHLRVALEINDPVFSVDGSGRVQPSARINAQHPQVRSCLVVGDVEKTSACLYALDAEIDNRLWAQASGGRGRAAKQGSSGFDAPDPIPATLGRRGLDRLMFDY